MSRNIYIRVLQIVNDSIYLTTKYYKNYIFLEMITRKSIIK